MTDSLSVESGEPASVKAEKVIDVEITWNKDRLLLDLDALCNYCPKELIIKYRRGL